MADTGPKRSDFQREQDYVEIARRYLQGETQASIAEHIGVTQQQISADLKTIQKRWLKSVTMMIDAAKAKELAKIDLLEQTYWNAWFASITPKEIKSSEVFTVNGDGNATKKASLKTEQRDGNPAFLAGVDRCIERRCKLLGLDAPVKLADADGGKLPETKVIVVIGDDVDDDKVADQP